MNLISIVKGSHQSFQEEKVRALAGDPKIILMDEPFSALDPISRQKLQQDIVKLQKKIKKTIVFVTHDMQEALALGDRICVMKDGEVVQCDTPTNIISNPKNDFVENFFKSGNAYNTCVLKGEYKVKDLIDIELYNHYKYKTQNNNISIDDESSFEDLLKLLKDEELILVRHKGEIIGTIDSNNVVKFISMQLEKGGDV